MYKGLSLSLIGVTPFIAIRMSTYESLAKKFESDDPLKNIVVHSFSGAIAGLVAITLVYPLDPLRRLLQLNGTSP